MLGLQSTDFSANQAGLLCVNRWKRHGRSSSRLRGEDLDRRIVNNDPERMRRQIMEQRRLESGKAKVCICLGFRIITPIC